MNCYVFLRMAKPLLIATNSSRIAANRSVNVYLTKSAANYCNYARKTLLGDLKSFSVKQVAVNSRRVMSNNTAPLPSYKSKDHSHVWLWERIVTVGLLGVIPFVVNQTPDGIEYLAALLVTVHLHWGLEAICTDYLRPAVVGTFIPKCIPIIVTVPLLFALYGVANSIMMERGITHVLKQFWYLKTTEQLKNEKKELAR